MARVLALSIRPQAEVVPIRREIEASRTEFSLVWTAILTFCAGCWTAIFYVAFLIWRATR